MPDIAGLIERVRAATGPDRELDAEIALACGAVVEPAVRDSFGAINVPAWWTMPNEPREVWPHRASPWRLTASLDAALALVERVLPNTEVRMHWVTKPAGLETIVRLHRYRPPRTEWMGNAPTQALALIAALLASLTDEP